MLSSIAAASTPTASFTPLGLPPNDGSSRTRSIASDVSADGQTVVGHGVGNRIHQAFVWTSEGGMAPLVDSFESGVGLPRPASAWTISADGRAIGGEAFFATQTVSPDGGSAAWALQPLPEGFRAPKTSPDTFFGYRELSADGSVALGSLTITRPPTTRTLATWAYSIALIDTASGQLRPVLEFEPTWWEIIGTGLSDDGRVVVGDVNDDTVDTIRAFRWTDDGGAGEVAWFDEDLAREHPALFELMNYTHATAISGDGSVVAGWVASLDPRLPEPFRSEFKAAVGTGFLWHEDGRIDLLGDFEASAMSANGDVLAGGGLIHTERLGIRTIEEIVALAGLTEEIAGWHALAVSSMSANGEVLVGKGQNPDGFQEAFRLEIPGLATLVPEPTLAGALLGAGAIVLRRKRVS